MIHHLEPVNFLNLLNTNPVIDVRSPGEFSQGHIPGAINIPLFTDAERAIVGTEYFVAGKGPAIHQGLEIALPKKEDYLLKLKGATPQSSILVYCWRGGMRSMSMSRLFSGEGYDIGVLTGGYKAYRRYIRESFSNPANILVLGGYTGSGKTEMLEIIARKGEQVIDLENLACHKGSVFGDLGQAPQPTNEQFENDLFKQWSRFDFTKPVWVEDESRMIGKVTLPDPVFQFIMNGKLLLVTVKKDERVKRLVAEYSHFDKEKLATAIKKISERLGGTRTHDAMMALENGSFDIVAGLMLEYYDKAYRFSISRRKTERIFEISQADHDLNNPVSYIIEFAYQHFADGTNLS